MYKRLIFILTVIVFWVLIREDCLAPGIAFSPNVFELVVTDNSSVTNAIKIYNPMSSTLHLKVYVQDFLLGADGKGVYLSGGKLPTSIASWIQFNPREFTVKPKESQVLRFTITPPADASGEYWGTIFLENTPPPAVKGKKGVNLVVNLRVGIPVYIYTGKIPVNSSLSINNIELDEKSSTLFIETENKGNVHIRPTGEVRLYSNEELVAQFNIPPFVVLTKSIRILNVPITQTIMPGKYRVEVYINYNAESRVKGELQVTLAKKLQPKIIPTPKQEEIKKEIVDDVMKQFLIPSPTPVTTPKPK